MTKKIMNKSIKIESVPTEFHITKKKKFIFNLNKYRNAHYHDLNKAKKYFHEWVYLLGIKERFKVPVIIKYFITCRNGSDFMNYGAVVDKFFQDALVKCGVLIDDNTKYVHETRFKFVKNGKLNIDVIIMVEK